ncbi:MAG: type II toxin-antitoxin system VapC family toxin [Bryobacteraceae bacterium]
MLIDTGTLLRTLQPLHPQRETARAAIKALTARGRDLHIVPQNLVELWVVATRPVERNGLGMAPDTVAMELTRIKSMFDLLPETPAICPAWERLVIEYRVFGKPAHDARLVAAMQVHGLTSILTFDGTGFSRYAGIEVVHPADAAI